MPRKPKVQFHYRELDELTRQLIFAPSHQRVDFVVRAERLHDLIEVGVDYPLDYVLYQLTRRRPPAHATVNFQAQHLVKDLRTLIDQVSRSAPVEVSAKHPAQTLDELANQLNVSTRTIRRWRDLGLRWRWVSVTTPDGTRTDMGFTPEAVKRFLSTHTDRVTQASQYQRMGKSERDRLIERARKIAQQREVSLHEVAVHLARRTGRALETVRLILTRHDEQHPTNKIFADRSSPLPHEQRRQIATKFSQGASASELARAFGRTRSTIYRAVREQLAAQVKTLAIHYVHSPLFDHPDAAHAILDQSPTPSEERTPRPAPTPTRNATLTSGDLPAPLAKLYDVPTPRPEDEKLLLVQYNFLKYRASRTRDQLNRYEPRAGDLESILCDLRHAAQLRCELVRGNLARVLTTARRHLMGHEDTQVGTVLELVEQGLAVLAQTLEAHDITRPQSFESALSYHMMRRFIAPPTPRSRAQRRLGDEEIATRIDRAISAAQREPACPDSAG
ncbi:MAG: helix-turn-helix domain-containing protein [Phycisphaera sp.]|nr:helix-turn-helix domain-containing protein [Phycisphaera sp.]